MKKIYLLLMFIALAGVGLGQVRAVVSENFDGLSESSYGNYTYNGFYIFNGLCNSTNARSGNAVRLRNATSYLEYQGADGNGKDGGVGTISFWYRSWDSSPAAVFDVKVNINGAGWTDIGSQINTTSTTYSNWSHDLNNSNDNILIKIEWVSGERLHIDDFSITDYSASTPIITLSVSTLTGFSYVYGSGPSSEQSFTAEGSSLTADISLAPPTNYEISTSTGGSFVATNPITLTQSGGTVSSTTIYTRLKAGLNVGDYNSEDITATSTDATSKTVTCSGSVIKGEPTNHVTDLSASANSTIITLTWTENDGAIVPDGYLIKANTGTITAPSDGTDPDDDTDLTDGAGNMEVAHGITSYSFTNCSPTTTYNFEIYPYTNSGITIDFKTTSAPSDAATTGAAAAEPIAGNLVITEVAGDDIDGTNDDDGFLEIYNITSNVLSLANVSARYYNSNPGAATQTVSLSGVIAAGSFIIVAQNDANFESEYGFAPDFIGSNFYFNGGDDGCDIYHSTNGILDQFNEVGAGTSPWTWSDNYSWDRNTQSSGATQANWTANTVGTPKSFGLAVWTGGTSTTWNDNDNWTFIIPTASTNVIISQGATNYPTLSTAGTCNNITIESNSLGNASILGNSNLTVSGTTTVERYFNAYTGADDGWHYIGSPVDNMAISGTDFDPTSTANDLYEWDEVSYLWRSFQNGTFSNLVNGMGYMVAYASEVTNSFTGSLNSTDVSFSNLTKTTGKGEGWHLLGNPYASALKWNDGNWTLTGVGLVAKVYDESAGNYVDVNANGIIPSTNGFFVQVSSATNSITIPSAARTHDATNNYKSSRTVMDETLQLLVNNDANGFSDITTIGFRDDAEMSFDWDFDSQKMFGQSTAPQLWTLIEGEELSTNNLPFVYESFTLPLNFKAGVNSTYHIIAEGLQSFYVNSEIYLEDVQTDVTINLRDESMYTFDGQPSDDNARFVLHFFGVTSADDISDTELVNIYGNGSKLFIKTETLNESYNIEVYDIMGRQILSDNFISTGLNTFMIDSEVGVYIVKLQSSVTTYVEKINLR